MCAAARGSCHLGKAAVGCGELAREPASGAVVECALNMPPTATKVISRQVSNPAGKQAYHSGGS